MNLQPRTIKILSLIGLWGVAGTIYVVAALHQRQSINLSATAGGQYPYLDCAEQMAKETERPLAGDRYWGDRNRMPLVPLLFSQVHHRDWDVFFSRCTALAIVTSMLALLGLGIITYRLLSFWPATVWMLTATFVVFQPKASFVQAELLYYTAIFALWLLCCWLLRREDWRISMLVGLIAAVAYLTKASALVGLGVYLATQGGAGLLRLVTRHWGRQEHTRADAARSACRTVAKVAIPIVVFVLVSCPYLLDNKERFGRYFYNVNSTFFMWCDSWPEAKAFADRFDIGGSFPDAPPTEIPSPRNHWNSHSLVQMSQRMTYGMTSLARLAWEKGFARYWLASTLLLMVVAWRFKADVAHFARRRRGLIVFNLLFFGGYLTVYAWYVPIAFGDRFVLSLLLPGMFLVLWSAERLVAHGKRTGAADKVARLFQAGCVVMTVFLLGGGLGAAFGEPDRPNPEFIQFYFNESQEAIAGSRPAVGERGLEGVVKLAPRFAPAHHELGMLAMHRGRFGEAVAHLSRAVDVLPNNANMLNSLGSAMIQDGQTESAVAALEESVGLDPEFASAWYNLAGAYHRLGRDTEAREALNRIRRLDSRLANQLERLLADHPN